MLRGQRTLAEQFFISVPLSFILIPYEDNLIRHTRVAVETGICYGWSDVGVALLSKPKPAGSKKTFPTNSSISCIAARSPLPEASCLCGFHEPILDDRLKNLTSGEGNEEMDDLTDPRLELWYKDWIHLPAGGGEAMKVSAAVSLNFWMNSAIPAIPMYFLPTEVIACAMVYAGICPIEESFSIEVDYGSKNVLEF